MSVVQLPPLQIVEGQDAYFFAKFIEGKGPVKFDGWSGEIKLAHDRSWKAFWTAPVQLDAQGNVSVTIPHTETDAFCVRRVAGLDTVGMFQITLTAPVPEFNEIWQGAVAITGVIE